MNGFVMFPAWSGLLQSPEFGAISGCGLSYCLFLITGGRILACLLDGIMNWANVFAQLGLIAISACLLMIAGEFLIYPWFHWSVLLGDDDHFLLCIGGGTFGSHSFCFRWRHADWLLEWLYCVKTGLPSFYLWGWPFSFILRGWLLRCLILFTNRHHR